MFTSHALDSRPRWQWLFRQRKSVGVVAVAPSAAAVNGQSAHLAFHRAYCGFVQEQPGWVACSFADLLLARVLPVLAANRPLPTGHELAQHWDRQFGLLTPMPQRLRQQAELMTRANHFLLPSVHQSQSPARSSWIPSTKFRSKNA